MIPVRQIDIAEQRMRYDDNDPGIPELAMDIAQHKLMQPIGVSETPNGRYQLRWGGRRLAAHKKAGLSTIWAHIYEAGDESVKATALRENIQRLNLTLQEEVDAVIYFNETEGKSPSQICDLLSKGRTWVDRRLTLPNLPKEVQEAVLGDRISLGAAEEISRLDNEGDRRYLISQAIQSGLTIADVRELAQALQKAREQTEGMEEAIAIGVQTRPIEPQLPCNRCGVMTKASELQVLIVRVHPDNNCPDPEKETIQ